MKNIWLKILLIFLMLIPIPFSCKDNNECMDLYVEPYYSAQKIIFKHVDKYWVNQKTNTLMFDLVSLEYDTFIYAADSMALYFEAPNDELLYHSYHERKINFSFTQETYACLSRRAGWAGTRDLVDKIYISSSYPYNEAHGKDYDLSDIVDIFAYSSNEVGSWMSLSDYNKKSPYEAPKRFYLLFKSAPTVSKTHQFVVKYYMKNEPGTPSKYFIIETPIFQMR